MSTLTLNETLKLIKAATKKSRGLEATIYCDGILFVWHTYVDVGESTIAIKCEGYVRCSMPLHSCRTKLTDGKEVPRFHKYNIPVRLDPNRYGIALDLSEILHITCITQQGNTDRSQTLENRIEVIRTESKHGTYESGQVINHGYSLHYFGCTMGSSYGECTLLEYANTQLSTNKIFDVTMVQS